ncbi:SHOCT domain-containing protein [Blastomonas aquatica]|uniref:SHOCT domain-containing protein n=1 Tax=Blastomonas aquatica TaxID=1510276 RepID=A0ABQ1IST8_9SPHN|nr:SHOCT domain-containing protein [Blastomonas aquatica]GGB51557.1 hypothetical protein GCM10010833_02850 [Blastomonas aquatica]
MSEDTDLDRLERLNRLREAGALTGEEFDAKKREILSSGSESGQSRPTRLVWAIGVAVLAMALAAVIYLAGNSTPASEYSGDAVVATVAPSIAVADPSEPSTKESVPSAGEMLAFATSDNVIGMSPAFLEQRLGTPKDKRPGTLVYDIGGCTINFWSEGDRITTLFFNVSRSCQVTIMGRKISPKTTFGQISTPGDSGAITATCLADCGNAADPTIDLRFGASRATNDVGISFSTDSVQSSDALELWEKEVRHELGLGEFDPTYDTGRFNCATRPSRAVKQLADKLTVRRVLIVRGEFGGC